LRTKDRRSAADIASTRSTSTGGLYTVEARNYRQIYLAFLKAATGWSSTATASRLTDGSAESPSGTDQDFKTPAASSQKSQ
jgi:hypothetical protein